MEFKFWCPYIKFYWNMDTSMCLHTVYICFCIIATELSSCDSCHMSCKSLKHLLSGLLQRRLVDYWFIVFSRRERKMGSRHTGIGLKQEKGYLILWSGERVRGLCKFKQVCSKRRERREHTTSTPHSKLSVLAAIDHDILEDKNYVVFICLPHSVRHSAFLSAALTKYLIESQVKLL